MKATRFQKITILILWISLVTSGELIGQYAPITTAGSSTVCPDSVVTVPITVTNFNQISAISLRLDINPTQLNYTGYANLNAGLAGCLVNRVIVSASLHKIFVVWSNVYPLTLTNGSKLLDLKFTLLSGNPTVSFNNTSNGGNECEYADSIGDPLIDVPTENFYFNATITNNGIGAAGTITGSTGVCEGTQGIYSVPAITNATGYFWSVPTGATIVSGTNTDTILVNFTGASSGNITVAGTGTCGTGSSSSLAVTVSPIPSPTITGSDTLCLPAVGEIYTTESGQFNYSWTISSGGTITAGSGTNAITVTWDSAGSQSITVNYENSGGCSAASATQLPVLCNERPSPIITGNTAPTVGASGESYTTEAGMTGYTWAVSAGGSITSGAGTDSITVLWTSLGSQTVSVNYTNAGGCPATSATILNVTIAPRDAPVTTAGSGTFCPDSSFFIPITVTGFTDISAISLRMDYNPTLMTYTGYSSVNASLTGTLINNVAVSASLNKVIMAWSDVTPLTLADNSLLFNLNFTLLSGDPILEFNNTENSGSDCEYADAYGNQMNDIPTGTYYINAMITNNGIGAAGTITCSMGVNPICQGQSNVAFVVADITNATGYVWTVPAGASIVYGANTDSILVNFSTTAVSGNVTVYGTNSCGNGTVSPAFAVTISPLPGAAGPISGPTLVQQGQSGVEYSIPAVANATGYTWTVPVGATIASGSNTDTITVDFGMTSQSGDIIVYGTNACGDGIPDTLAVSVGFNISGTFLYNNSANTTLDSLWVFLKDNGVKIDSTQTNLNGEYQYTGIAPGTYTLAATTGKPWGGVNATDAIKIQRHFVGLEPLTIPVRLLAGDVNNSNFINATDAIKIKRRFVGLDSSFARGDWTFAKPTGGNTVILTGTNVVQDFQGLCVGDVNGSYTPAPGDALLSGIILTQQGTLEVSQGKPFNLEIRSFSRLEIGALSLVLTFPSDGFSLTDVLLPQGTPLYTVQGDQLRIAWSEIEPFIVLPDNPLITLVFMPNDNGSWDTPFTLTALYESELADGYGIPISQIDLYYPNLNVMEAIGIPENQELLSTIYLFPNPAKEEVSIEFRIEQTATVSFDLFNTLGVLGMHLDYPSLGSGSHKKVLDVSLLSRGSYFLRSIVTSRSGTVVHTSKLILN